MNHQPSFSEAEYSGKKLQTRRDQFLNQTEKQVPWQEWIALFKPFYPKGERGRLPIGCENAASVFAASMVQLIERRDGRCGL